MVECNVAVCHNKRGDGDGQWCIDHRIAWRRLCKERFGEHQGDASVVELMRQQFDLGVM